MIKNLLDSSVRLKAELEIQGDADALIKSQDFYNTELSKINSLYS